MKRRALNDPAVVTLTRSGRASVKVARQNTSPSEEMRYKPRSGRDPDDPVSTQLCAIQSCDKLSLFGGISTLYFCRRWS